jgi:hypothetical protein
MAVLVKDEKGSSALELAILLPLFLFVLLAGFELWRLSMVKRALYLGTYQTARYLANNRDTFPQSYSPRQVGRTEAITRSFILAELEGTSLDLPEAALSVEVIYGAPCVPSAYCGGYEVAVSAMLDIPVNLPHLLSFVPPPTIILRGQCVHDPCVECGRG